MKIQVTKKFVDKLYGRISKETIMDFLSSINPYYSIRQFILKTVKGFQWFAFSWNVYWFDYSYIEQTLAWQLKYMGEKFIKDGHCEGAKQSAKEMLYIADRIQKLSDGIIDDQIYKHHELKFPNKPSDFFTTVEIEEGIYSWEESDAMKAYKKTEEGKKELKEFRKLIPRIEKAKQKEREQIYMFIAKHIRGWWD